MSISSLYIKCHKIRIFAYFLLLEFFHTVYSDHSFSSLITPQTPSNTSLISGQAFFNSFCRKQIGKKNTKQKTYKEPEHNKADKQE